MLLLFYLKESCVPKSSALKKSGTKGRYFFLLLSALIFTVCMYFIAFATISPLSLFYSKIMKKICPEKSAL